MAYIVETLETVNTNTASFAVNLPAHQTGDLLVIFAGKDDATGGVLGTPSGWTLIQEHNQGTSGNNTLRAGCWYKIATSGAEADPVVTSSDTDDWLGQAYVIRDHDAVTPIDISSESADTAGAPYTVNGATTTTDNCLVLFAAFFDGVVTPGSYPGIIETFGNDDTSGLGHAGGWTVQAAAGATGSHDFYANSTADEMVGFCVCIRNASGGRIPAYPSKPGLVFVNPLTGQAVESGGGAQGNINNTHLMGTAENPTQVWRFSAFGGWTDLTTEATNATDADVSPFEPTPANQAVNDEFYIGFDNPIAAISFDRAGCTAGVAGVFSKELSNGSGGWTTCGNLYDQTSNLNATVGDRHVMGWRRTQIAGMGQNTVNGVAKYYVRLRLTTVYTTAPTISQIYGGQVGLAFDALGAVADTGINPFQGSIASSPSISGAVFSGSFHNFGSAKDLSAGILVGSFIFGTPRDYIDTGPIEYGGIPLAILSDTNRIRTWQIGGFNNGDTAGRDENLFAVQPSQSTDTSFVVSATPPTLTAIASVGIMAMCTSGSALVYWSRLLRVDEVVFNGGTSTNPLSWEDLVAAANGHLIRLLNGESGRCLVPLRIGGDNPVSVDANLFALFWPNQANGAEYSKFHVDDLVCGLTIDARAGDVVKIRSASITGNSPVRFEMLVTCSVSATYDFAGLTLVNCVTTLRAVATFASMAFINCTSIAQNGATLNASSFTGSLLQCDDPSELSECAFTSDGSGHAIEMDTPGTYAFTGNTFAGYGADGTTDAAIYNNSGGLITLNLGAGDTVPTVRNGVGASTVINAVSLQGTISGYATGSRVQVYNVTTATETYNAVPGASPLNLPYTEGGDYTTGDVIRVRIAYQSGASANEPHEYLAVATGGGWSVLDTPEAAESHNAYGVDGSAVSEFTWDSLNLEIDVDDPDNTTVIQRIGAWYYYFIATAIGIDELFGGMDWRGVNEIRVDTTKVDLLLNNVDGVNPLRLTGGRIYRSDGATVIAAGSGSIHIDYDPVYTIETGTSGLTAGESAQLFGIPTNPVLDDDVRLDEIKAKTDQLSFSVASKVDANIKNVNNLAVVGSGTEGDPWGPV